MNLVNAYLKADHWRISLTKTSPDGLLASHGCNIQFLDDSAIGSKCFLADPFGFLCDGQLYVLCERFHFNSRIADIVCCKVTHDNKLVDIKVALSMDSHLSFPYVFSDAEQIYFCPESSAERRVAIYKMGDAPSKWDLYHVISDSVSAIDSVIFRSDGLWWCLYSTKDHGSHSSLHAKYAKELNGDWYQHRNDPLLIRQNTARNGGTPFNHMGVWYRLVQDSSKSYGEGLQIYRIDVLTPEDYSESFVCAVNANLQSDNDLGVHTLSGIAGTDLSFIDIKTRRLSIRAASDSLRRFRRKVLSISRT